MADLAAEAAAYLEQEAPYDANDAEQVNNARQKHTRKRAAELRMIGNMMATVEGRRYWYNLLAKCGTFMAPAFDTPHLDAKAAGRQQVGHWILEDIMQAAYDQFGNMLKENHNKKID